MMNNSTITAITHRFILGTHIRQKLYQKIICDRFILGSKPLLINNSIKQNTPCHANYQINSVGGGNINVAIRSTFILAINKKSVMPEMIQKPDQYRYVGLNSNGELEFKVDSRSYGKNVSSNQGISKDHKTYTITVSIIHDDSISSVPTIQIKHKDKDECEGYKHRENCWHIKELKLDECYLCLAPLVIKPFFHVNYNDEFRDQYNNVVFLTNLAFNGLEDLYVHDECGKCLYQLQNTHEDRFI